MKKLILSLALLLAFAVVPAIAGDFQALNNLSDQEQMALNTMTNEQLAVVEGALFDIQANISFVDDITQTQTAAQSASVSQSNSCTFSRCKNEAKVTQFIAQSQSGVAQANVD
jgi:hypothetical protein